MIDNSAVIFSDPKKTKNPKFKRNDNPLQSEVDKSDNEGDYKSNEDGKSNRTSYKESEGEDGEGESFSSSCTCSSCLKEKNADNAVSLKLSQYSYKPTNGDFQRNETDGETNLMNMSGFREMQDTSMYNDKSTTNKDLNNSKIDRSVEDFSNNPPNSKNYFKELDKSVGDFPDNLNNG
eukprot:CAMPEP_0205804016 /NCGR_PEP_ID=MMETSP0205-20121125/6790_1 /ASSEMBLY_ACC=CAM_ASM_000278 /TAXON_ID=36767 /ORGANISM="Euplotes focardii, Strain TN1" /LENGTH=177 /DNA_ID=CAMNT_0053072913 /DNA_START=812 /DNA_END=1341 /DNA_ORIENTATION=+